MGARAPSPGPGPECIDDPAVHRVTGRAGGLFDERFQGAGKADGDPGLELFLDRRPAAFRSSVITRLGSPSLSRTSTL